MSPREALPAPLVGKDTALPPAPLVGEGTALLEESTTVTPSPGPTGRLPDAATAAIPGELSTVPPRADTVTTPRGASAAAATADPVTVPGTGSSTVPRRRPQLACLKSSRLI